jgi:hypothetical protein
MKTHFNGGKDFDFSNYKDRVILGQALIDKLHETFPDSNFTTVQNNYCEHHKIEW